MMGFWVIGIDFQPWLVARPVQLKVIICLHRHGFFKHFLIDHVYKDTILNLP